MDKHVSLAELGKDLELVPSESETEQEVLNNNVAGCWPHTDENKDYFIERDGQKFAGTHLIIDLWGATNLDNLDVMEQALRDSVREAKATLLHIHLHHFTPNGGISGVAVLAESHISVHSWPEKGYAAFDIFMCGESEPAKAIPVLQAAFGPERVEVGEILRGKVTQ